MFLKGVPFRDFTTTITALLRVSIAVVNHHHKKKQVVEERICLVLQLSGHIQSLREVGIGAQGRSLDTGTDEGHKGMLLTGLLLKAF